MTWISTMFHQGGPTMFWIEYLGVPGLIIALIHVVRPAVWARWATLAVLVLVLAAGLYGRHQGRRMTEEGVAGMEREADRVEIMEAGYLEASRPIQFAGLVAGGLAVLLAIGELRLRATRGSRSGRSAAAA